MTPAVIDMPYHGVCKVYHDITYDEWEQEVLSLHSEVKFSGYKLGAVEARSHINGGNYYCGVWTSESAATLWISI